MRARFKIVIVVLLGIAILIPSILVYASETNTYFFSRDLQVTDFVFNDGSYIANVSDSGVLVAGLNFRIEHSVANLTSHRIQRALGGRLLFSACEGVEYSESCEACCNCNSTAHQVIRNHKESRSSVCVVVVCGALNRIGLVKDGKVQTCSVRC